MSSGRLGGRRRGHSGVVLLVTGPPLNCRCRHSCFISTAAPDYLSRFSLLGVQKRGGFLLEMRAATGTRHVRCICCICYTSLLLFSHGHLGVCCVRHERETGVLAEKAGRHCVHHTGEGEEPDRVEEGDLQETVARGESLQAAAKCARMEHTVDKSPRASQE